MPLFERFNPNPQIQRIKFFRFFYCNEFQVKFPLWNCGIDFKKCFKLEMKSIFLPKKYEKLFEKGISAQLKILKV